MSELGPPPPNPKEVVRAGYDACADRYNEERDPIELTILQPVLDGLDPGSSVLEVGCGGGRPVGEAVASRAAYTGVDISPAQIEIARGVLPDSRLILGDIGELSFEDAEFDAIVSFYTLFHLPRDEHRAVLARFHRWLRPGGQLMVSVARSGHEGYTEDDFFGARMFWSHHEPEWYVDTLTGIGFRDIIETSIPPGRSDTLDHPVLVARA